MTSPTFYFPNYPENHDSFDPWSNEDPSDDESYHQLEEEPNFLVATDRQTKLALQIFTEDNHPSVYKQGSSSKEGLSLFALYNRCVSKVGRITLRKVFEKPTYDLEELNQRLEMVEFFISRQDLVKELRGYLKHISDSSSIINRIKLADLSVRDWHRLFKIVRSVIEIASILQRIKEPGFLLAQKFLACFEASNLFEVATLIYKTIDFGESLKSGRFQVRSGVDPKLDRLKKIYQNLPDILTREGEDEIHRFQEHVEFCCLSYVPLLGFHLQAKLSPERLVLENYRISGLDFRYRLEDIIFYKSELCEHLDNRFGDIFTEINDLQRQHQAKLQCEITEQISALPVFTNLSAKMDCFTAIAETCSVFKYTRPVFSSNNEIQIIGGRHPLQEIFVQEFIPNDCISREAGEKIHVITGPNACGKSIYLKQICLIVYMSQIGSFVPAQYANISPVDRIFTRIKSNDSVSCGMSTFLADTLQIAKICREFTEKSLIAIDEFGKSTDPRSGFSLLAALLDYFIESSKGAHIFITTHFLSLSDYICYDTSKVMFKTFEVIIQDDSIAYKFKLIDGKSSASRAILVARAIGLDVKFIERAKQVEKFLLDGFQIQPIFIPKSANNARRLINVAEYFIKFNFEETDPCDLLLAIKEL